MTTRRSIVAAGLAASLLAPALVCAQSAAAWPNKPIRLIVPYPPGGGTDVTARVLSRKLTDALGQQVLVENRPGASTIIGTDAVAKSPADGYTIGLVTDSHAINFGFKRPLPYRESDFTPVVQLLNVPLVLLVNSKVPARNLKELVAHAKANPDKLNFGSLGSGSPHQLAMEWLNHVAGTQIAIIAYKGIAPALMDVVGGQADMMFAGSAVANEHIKAGRLRAIAVTTPRRAAAAPDVPTIAEDYPSYAVNTWYGIVAPAGLPKAITERLNREFVKALQADDVKQQLATLGSEVAAGSPADLERLIQTDTAKWTQVIQVTGAKPE